MAKRQSTENDYPYPDEVWKLIPLNVPEHVAKLEVSNYGRVRSLSSGTRSEFIQGATTRTMLTTIQQRYFIPRDPEEDARLKKMRNELTLLRRDLRFRRRSIEARGKNGEKVPVSELRDLKTDQDLYDGMYKLYRNDLEKDDKSRGKRYGGYVHRFVATAFVERPSPEHSNVIHIDYNNQNNHCNNLKWVTHEELTFHNNNNERIIKDRESRKGRFNKGNKLNETKVVALKNALVRGKTSTKTLSKQFGVSEAQIRHIKRGGSWAHVKADENAVND